MAQLCDRAPRSSQASVGGYQRSAWGSGYWLPVSWSGVHPGVDVSSVLAALGEVGDDVVCVLEGRSQLRLAGFVSLDDRVAELPSLGIDVCKECATLRGLVDAMCRVEPDADADDQPQYVLHALLLPSECAACLLSCVP